MDGSSLGRDYEMFTLILRNIERALKDVVDGKGPEDFLLAKNCVLVISIAPSVSSNPHAELKKYISQH